MESSGNKVKKKANLGKKILDHVCNTISKSAHHKSSPKHPKFAIRQVDNYVGHLRSNVVFKVVLVKGIVLVNALVKSF